MGDFFVRSDSTWKPHVCPSKQCLGNRLKKTFTVKPVLNVNTEYGLQFHIEWGEKDDDDIKTYFTVEQTSSDCASILALELEKRNKNHMYISCTSMKMETS